MKNEKCETKLQTDLLEGEIFINKKSQKQARQNKEETAKGVLVFIVRPSHNAVMPHVPNNWKRTTQEYKLHYCIVQRHKICEYIQVSGGENQSVELLSLQWNACKLNGHNAIKLLVIEK